MTTLMSYSGPFSRCIKPKVYFQETQSNMRDKLIRSSAMVKSKELIQVSPRKVKMEDAYQNEFYKMLPWMITSVVLIIALVF